MRGRILEILRMGNNTVRDMEKMLDVSDKTIWKHLKRLEKEGKVKIVGYEYHWKGGRRQVWGLSG